MVGTQLDHDSGEFSYAAIERLNRRYTHPILSQLVRTRFFRYFKVNLDCECTLWEARGKGQFKADDKAVPKPWRAVEKELGHLDDNDPSLAQPPALGDGFDNPWMCENGSTEYTYVDLLANPERHTGYKGTKARRVWQAIYANKAMSADDAPEARQESTIFYRLISGMQSSVTVHIARDYLLNEETGERGPNLAVFAERIGTPQHKERVHNLYYLFLFVLHAVESAAQLLGGADYSTGKPQEDERTADLVKQLVASLEMWQPSRSAVQGQEVWASAMAQARQLELQAHFRQISAALDCVTCNKCKLWGKLQMLGLASALKIVFRDPSTPVLLLERNEIIAMINLLNNLSTSIETVRQFAAQLLHGSIDLHKGDKAMAAETLAHRAEAKADAARPVAKISPKCVRASASDDGEFEEEGEGEYGCIADIVQDSFAEFLVDG
ncbi:hypothetical protein WJX72_003551 [[Myrmecia] bisecta]|uniref:Endoplasmic reticulum oxidoreductin 1 n=1 Tax=[Myrmecia] bisecta TaxID=41462 RepID=A0AAW1QEP1_9CHLO